MNNNGVLLKSNTLFQIPTSLFLHSNKTPNSLFLIQIPKHKSFSFHLKVFSSKTTPATRTVNFEDEFDEEFEEDEDDLDEEFEEDDEEDEDEDEDIFVPLRNMRQWTRNKPRGFGEGKVYDTSLEDKLLEDLEQSRIAQIANINNLKNNPQDGNPNSKKEKLFKQKELGVVPNGIRVRLINLPKKKNIHRDLQVAFKPFTGIINIIPAVSGNEKTREPVCKGFAFVDFKSEKEANRFVDLVSTQPITFGKVQKQIRCEIIKTVSPNSDSVKPSVHSKKDHLPILNTSKVNSKPGNETPVDAYVEDAAFDTVKSGDDEFELATDEYNDKDFGKSDIVVQEKHEPEAGSESFDKLKKVREKGMKTTKTKKKAEITPKLNIPGSANRLKTKEKALLSGVFSKYGGKSSD